MRAKAVDYIEHFGAYKCKMYKVPTEAYGLLSEEDIAILNEFGLPDRGLPFFNFDLHLHFLRDIDIHDCKIVLGAGAYPGNDEYIFLHENGGVYYKEKNRPVCYINGSLRQLIDSIYTYSRWLQKLEWLSDTIKNYEMTEEDVFDIYYSLRAIDKKAVEGANIWNCLIQFDKPTRDFLTIAD